MKGHLFPAATGSLLHFYIKLWLYELRLHVSLRFYEGKADLSVKHVLNVTILMIVWVSVFSLFIQT